MAEVEERRNGNAINELDQVRGAGDDDGGGGGI
jgi:hypothetical protein